LECQNDGLTAGFTQNEESKRTPRVLMLDKTELACLLGGAALIALVAIVLNRRIDRQNHDPVFRAQQEQIALEAQRESEKNKAFSNPELAMSLTGMKWETGAFDTILLASFTIENRNTFPVKDIMVRCSLRAPSGTNLGSADHTIYEIVAPRAKRRFVNVNMGFIHSQAQKAGCVVSGATALYKPSVP
jgi:hypothetical protein